MNQKLYTITSSILLTMLLLVTSCNDVLEQEPLDTITVDQLYNTDADLEQAVAGVYSIPSNNWIFRRGRMLAVLELRADALMLGQTRRSGSRLELATFTYNPENEFIENAWQQYYKGIDNANVLLARGPEAASATDATKSRVLAEAHFFRAFFYLQLVRLFGSVPMPLVSPENYQQALEAPQVSVDELYQQIIEDAQFAAGEIDDNIMLPLTGDIDGRLTLGAAHALLADVHLTLGNYPETANYTQQIINSGQFALWENYADAFSIDLQYESNSAPLAENVYAVRFAPDIDPGSRFTNEAWPRGLVQPFSAQARRTGAGFFEVDQNVYDRIGPDIRRDSVIFPPTYALGSGAESILIAEEDTIKGGAYDGLPFNKPNDQNLYFCIKFESDNPRDRFGWLKSPFPVYRYADILLMNLEAKNEQGQATQEDVDLTINQTRARGGLEPLVGLGQDELREAIKEERFVEFFYEGKRFHDLVRWGDFVQAVNQRDFSDQNDYSIQTNINESFQVLPIPQREIDINPALQQLDGF